MSNASSGTSGPEAPLPPRLASSLERLPETPGVYLMRDRRGRILYIGKAVNLRNRVRSYFHRSVKDIKTRFLVGKVADIEWYTTATEQEALILEAGLIQKEKPAYNIRLKDDKNYPYLALTRPPYPRLVICRNKKDDHLAYFGPYTSVRSMRQALDFINRRFKLRKCGRDLAFGRKVGKPCLYFQMEMCLAPCQGHIPPEEYDRIVREVSLFLEGDYDGLVRRLEEEMRLRAERREFEAAGRLRDLIEDVRTLGDRQHITLPDAVETDIVTMAQEAGRTLFSVVFVRNERITGRRNFPHTDSLGLTPADLLADFLKRFYSENPAAAVVLVPHLPEEAAAIAAWLSAKHAKPFRIAEPSTLNERRMVSILELNTRRQLSELLLEERSKPSWGRKACTELGQALGLPKPPRRIEAFDISNLGSDAAVASMVSFLDGRPDKANYRRFHIRSVQGQNDFAMIRETVGRRYQRLLNEKARLPDLVLIDGGPGQLRQAREILLSLGLDRLPVIALAKREELVHLPDRKEPLRLPLHSKALHLLQTVRDEAHRFALAFHRKTREQHLLKADDDKTPAGTAGP